MSLARVVAEEVYWFFNDCILKPLEGHRAAASAASWPTGYFLFRDEAG
jgi:hypothetical protein